MEVFYLKFNQNEHFVHQYANIWFDIIKEIKDSYIYCIVDKADLRQILQQKCDFKGIPHEFIQSQRDSVELQKIVKALSPNWYNAGYAHLTTFLHARDHGYKEFWNIDGDDMALLANPVNLAKIFGVAKDYAKKNNLHVFGMDAWYTASLVKVWNFGITYVNNSINWIDLLTQYADSFAKAHKQPSSSWNIDVFLNYLSRLSVIAAKMFYVENLYSILNNLGNPYMHPLFGSLRYWKDGKLHFPTLIRDFGMGSAGSLPIPKDVVKIDVKITPEECMERMRQIASTSLTWKIFTPPRCIFNIYFNKTNFRRELSLKPVVGKVMRKINYWKGGAAVWKSST